jgi:NTP pyrophosphatase (non-canonical NTP hydrolase)
VNREQQMVAAFHERFGYPIADCPSQPADPSEGVALALARMRLIREEANELAEALADRDLVRAADAMADLLYVTYGTGVAYGIDLEPVFAEAHRSNMTKTPSGGDKPSKDPGYQPPNIEVVLAQQERRFAVQDLSGTVTIAPMESDSWQ